MPVLPSQTDVTIVGGGFAGLAAALRLHRAGAKIQIVEKRPFFGGRAYSFTDRTTGETLDNGQHLLMGCYHETIRFLDDLGTLPRLEIQKSLEVTFAQASDGFHRMHCPNLPAPLHLLFGLVSYSGLGMKDKWEMANFLRTAKKIKSNGRDIDAVSVRDFLREHRQTDAAIEGFWEPIALGALNESIELASAGLFLEVLKRALLARKSDSNLALSSVGLSDLYANPARDLFEKAGVPLHFQTQARALRREGNNWVLTTEAGAELRSSAVILAVPPPALAKLKEGSGAELAATAPGLELFQSSPIVSINLWLEDFHPPQTMVGLIGSPVHWVFNKARILKNEKSSHVTLVISGAADTAARSKDDLVAMAVSELQRFYPETTGKKLLHSQVVKEFDATFGTRTGLGSHKPGAATALPGLFLAGDWTHTGLPATIEGAVLSGHRAADAFLGK